MLAEKTYVIDGGKDNVEVRKVLVRSDGIKYIIIPKRSNLSSGDYVVITKLKEE